MTLLLGIIIGGLTGYGISTYLNRRNVYACTLLCKKPVSIVYFSLIGALLASSF